MAYLWHTPTRQKLVKEKEDELKFNHIEICIKTNENVKIHWLILAAKIENEIELERQFENDKKWHELEEILAFFFVMRCWMNRWKI